MKRRYFIRRLCINIQAMSLVQVIHPRLLKAALGQPNRKKPYFRPLNGRSLKKIAFKKEHHGNGIFLNPFGFFHKDRFLQLIQWKLGKNPFAPYLKDQKVFKVAVDLESIKNNKEVSVTFLKHSCIIIKDIDKYIFVDPIFSNINWFFKDFSPLSFNPGKIPSPDHVLITHGHYDHLDKYSLAMLKKKTHVISPLGYNSVFNDLKMKNRTPLDWYDTYRHGDLTVTLLPCNHWTMRNPFRGPNRSLWGSFLIQTAGGYTIYVSGDTAYFDGFEEIGNDFNIDLAVINLGAYEPRWFMAASHLNPEEAVMAFKALKAKRLLIVHWGTFRLGDEPIHFPPMDIKKELKKHGLLNCLVDIHHGETYKFDDV